MFYLKYRPRKIEEIDNQNVKKVIRNILLSDSLPHALLLSGQKGTGKTSTARIIAKTINCLNNRFNQKNNSVEPCNHCQNCRMIDNGSSTDIVELDAASNRGIDDIKNLIKASSFLPMACKYRVFIIDEAHMITKDAFNALLKTLEEPPKSVMFILATTNEEKIIKTIISRCTVIKFGKARKKDIISMLKRISKGEGLKIDEEIFPIIANSSEGSFRDGAKILEGLITQNKTKLEEAKKILGVLRQDLLELIQKNNLKEILLWIEEFNEQGGNFKNIITQLLEKLRISLLCKNGLESGEKIELELSQKEITTLIKLFTEAFKNLRTSPIPSLPLEMAVIEFHNRKNK